VRHNRKKRTDCPINDLKNSQIGEKKEKKPCVALEKGKRKIWWVRLKNQSLRTGEKIAGKEKRKGKRTPSLRNWEKERIEKHTIEHV